MSGVEKKQDSVSPTPVSPEEKEVVVWKLPCDGEPICTTMMEKDFPTYVGGYIQILPVRYSHDKTHSICLVCNEEGRLKNLPHNPDASALCKQGNMYGNILLTQYSDEKGIAVDLPSNMQEENSLDRLAMFIQAEIARRFGRRR